MSADMNNIKISIIVPVYNVEKYLRKCIDSILTQSYLNIELILVNDGSLDSSGSICEEYEKKDMRIIVVNKENAGLSEARNTGIVKATGSYYMFIDSDDFLPDANVVEDLVRIVKKDDKIDVVIARNQKYFEKDEKYIVQARYSTEGIANGDFLLKEFCCSGIFPIAAWAKLVNAKKTKDLFFKKGVYSEDIDWFCQIVDYCSSFYLTNRIAYVYRQRCDSLSTDISSKKVNDILSMLSYWTSQYECGYCKLPWQRKMLSFLAYEYAILMGLVLNVNKYERKTVWNKFEEMKTILQYEDCVKVKKVRMLYKLFGFKITCLILNLYMKWR